MTTITSREFNQDVGRAKKAANKGPVIITDRGSPSHVLLSIEHYRRITGKQKSLADLLAAPDTTEIEFEPERLGSLRRPADLS